MKIIYMLTALLFLVGCGSEDEYSPIFEARLPATFTSNGMIITSGVVLGDDSCSTTWPAEMPYETDAEGTYHADGKKFAPVEGKESTWSYQGERVDGTITVTTFTVLEDSVHVRLRCDYGATRETNNKIRNSINGFSPGVRVCNSYYGEFVVRSGHEWRAIWLF